MLGGEELGVSEVLGGEELGVREMDTHTHTTLLPVLLCC